MRNKNGCSLFWRLTVFLILQIASGKVFAQNKSLNNILPEKNKPLMLLWGLPDFESENLRQEAGKKKGIKLYRFAGCTLPLTWERDAQKHNKKLKKKIGKRFGDSWQNDYPKEIKRLGILFHKADTILSYNVFFQENRPVVPSMDIDKIYYSEADKDTVLLVNICSVSEWTNNNRLVIFKQFELNLVSKSVKLIANKTEDDKIIFAGH